MDKTDCLELSFPQCEPPLVKDASDIIQFQTLALEVDAAVQALDDTITEQLIDPDSVNMTGGITTAGNDIEHFTSAMVFDNAGMADTVADVVRIQEDGWYAVGGWVVASSASQPNSIGLRIEPLVNGDVVSSRQGPGQPAVGAEYVGWTDVLFLRAGDALTTMTHHTGTAVLSVTYATTLWAHLVLSND